jgi:hypothetical protein
MTVSYYRDDSSHHYPIFYDPSTVYDNIVIILLCGKSSGAITILLHDIKCKNPWFTQSKHFFILRKH